MPMTPDAKAQLSKTIRSLRERLLEDLGRALQGEYRLGIAVEKAKLAQAQERRRARLDGWVEEQLDAAEVKGKKERAAAELRFRGEVVKAAAYTLLNRVVYLRLLEAAGLRPMAVVTGGWRSRGYQDFRELAPGLTGDESEGYGFLCKLVFDELAGELPGLFGGGGPEALVPVPASTLRAVVEALDEDALASCWGDDMTLGWVYQYWNDPEREALDAKLNAGGKVERHEIASKTQMFTERYMVDWLLQNSLGPMWLAICAKHGWTAEVEADGTLARLEERRTAWRKKREAGEVALTELMPLETEAERRWAYYVPQAIPADAVEKAAGSVRDLKVLDPAVGSGHFLVVALELLVELYREEGRQRGESGEARWEDRAIVERVLGENLYGIDLDPRAVQIAAAALWLKARRIAPGAEPGRMGLVASSLRLAGLPDGDPGVAELCKEVERETGIPGVLTERIVQALKGADHLGSLLKVDEEVRKAVLEHEDTLGSAVADQGALFDGFEPRQQRLRMSPDEAQASVLARIEGFLARHSGSEDLGLRLRGEQLAAGVRFLRMVKEGTYDLVVGNPPYQGTSKLSDAGYVQREYPLGKADLYAAFLQRGLELAREGGVSALLTMRNWMFIKQYAGLREWLLEGFDLRALLDLSSGAFEEINAAQVVVSVTASIFRRERSTACESIAIKAFDDATVTTQGETARKRAATLCQVGRYDFDPAALKVVPEWPLVYWWAPDVLSAYAYRPQLGSVAPVLKGMSTQDNVRFLRRPWEVLSSSVFVSRARPETWPSTGWTPYIKGGEGATWFEPISHLTKWLNSAVELRVWLEKYVESKPGGFFKNPERYFELGVAVTAVGSSFSARLHRHSSVLGHMGTSAFPAERADLVCVLNSSFARSIVEALNPTVHFGVGDIERIPVVEISGALTIVHGLDSAFTTHESHREPSVEFLTPGPSPWRHAQAWAQLAVDRPEGTPLPTYIEELDPEPATDHLSYALGIALGRFSPTGAGILDPTTDSLTHALPSGILFLDATLDADDPRDTLGHPATTPLHAAWATHAAAISTTRKTLRDYLRLDFFSDVHRQMYENRPIHWPLSSDKKTFVAWITIHRLTPQTLRTLLAEHLHPTLTRLDGQLTDLRTLRDGADTKAARKAEKLLATLHKSRDELHQFITDVTQCAEKGPLPPDAKTPARETDSPYAPDLDDGVMINASALHPLLRPQWKDPTKWWKELCTAAGRKDYDWSHLAARYFPARVDHKCRIDPSLAVAHHCFWRYHPERAYAWELRLQDEISPDFTLDEPDSDQHRTAFLAAHPETAVELRAKEAKRRERKASKAGEDDQSDLFEADDD